MNELEFPWHIGGELRPEVLHHYHAVRFAWSIKRSASKVFFFSSPVLVMDESPPPRCLKLGTVNSTHSLGNRCHFVYNLNCAENERQKSRSKCPHLQESQNFPIQASANTNNTTHRCTSNSSSSSTPQAVRYRTEPNNCNRHQLDHSNYYDLLVHLVVFEEAFHLPSTNADLAKRRWGKTKAGALD